MINIASLTDHLNTPSSRFRVRQYCHQLSLHGINVTDYHRIYSTQSAGNTFPQYRIRSNLPKLLVGCAYEMMNIGNTFCRVLKTRKYDATWLSREVINGYPTFEKLIRFPFFYDIDDAVFLGGKIKSIGVRNLIRNSAAVFSGNNYLADYCSQYSSNVHIIPTAVDTNRYVPVSKNPDKREFIVGWSGTSSSYVFFAPLELELAKFFENHKDAKLKICSDRFPHELCELRKYIDFELWNPNIEVDQIQTFDVGIMPLDNSDWSRGKCSYKMLLYASCGIPTLTSPYGINRDILSLGRLGLGCETATDWRESLEFMYDNRNVLSSIFPDCRNTILNHYSLDAIVPRLSKIIYLTLGR